MQLLLLMSLKIYLLVSGKIFCLTVLIPCLTTSCLYGIFDHMNTIRFTQNTLLRLPGLLLLGGVHGGGVFGL